MLRKLAFEEASTQRLTGASMRKGWDRKPGDRERVHGGYAPSRSTP